MGRKPEGFFRIIPKAGKKYLIKVKNTREGDKVKQRFLFHIGSIEDIKKVICNYECPIRRT